MRESRNRFLIAFALLALVGLLAGPALGRAFQGEADAVAGVEAAPHGYFMLQHRRCLPPVLAPEAHS